MKKMKVSITAKLGKLEKSTSKDYEEPENWQEAIKSDGEAQAFKIFLIERKTRFQDKERKKLLDQMTKKLAEIMEAQGIEF
uniref:Uncharacterized protein n=1 Tax=viral metagenome TaxID=1070528 RepID=A0A6M3KIE0_9ZZZZ